jgi:lauroyl/myristoyl acyltransferase
METPLYWVARGAIALVQVLPLGWVARLGRAAGQLAYWLDARHRSVALQNLEAVFGNEKSPGEIRALARENFRRIGENFACAAKTFGMNERQIRSVLEFAGTGHLAPPPSAGGPSNRVVAVGHFGNFEIYARGGLDLGGYRCATTYRGLKQGSLTRLLQTLRAGSGCLYFERRTEAAALRAAMNGGGLVLGLLADQNARGRGLSLPFLGRVCSTTAAPALFALRYRCPLHSAICFRTGPGRWRLEFGPEIPTREHGKARSAEAIMRDVNRAFEAAVRRDPANWFWVHNRWKSRTSTTCTRSA